MRRKTNVVGRFVCLDNTSGDLVIWFLVGLTVLGSFWVKIGKTNTSATQTRESKTVVDSGIHVLDSGFQVQGSSLCQWNFDSRFLERYSGFQSPGFRIPRGNFSWSPDITSKNFPDFGIRTPLHGTTRKCGPNR